MLRVRSRARGLRWIHFVQLQALGVRVHACVSVTHLRAYGGKMEQNKQGSEDGPPGGCGEGTGTQCVNEPVPGKFYLVSLYKERQEGSL
jgi:hypothetical protein